MKHPNAIVGGVSGLSGGAVVVYLLGLAHVHIDLYAAARTLGWTVQRPQRGDLVLYDFDGDGQCDDHIGIITSVTAIADGFELHTVEGNTGAGSAADGDGVYLRVRRVKRGTAAYVRIPGVVPDAI